MSTFRLRITLGVAVFVVLGLVALRGRATSERAVPVGPPVSVLEAPAADSVTLPAPATLSVTTATEERVRGTSRDAAGAVRTAVSYLELTEEVPYLTPTQAGELQASISSAAASDRLGERIASATAAYFEAMPEGFTIWVAPIETRVTAVGDGFEVAVWYVEVLVSSSVSASSAWRTITYALVWEDGRWLIDDQVVAAGPTPAASGSPTPAVVLLASQAAFDDEGIEPWG